MKSLLTVAVALCSLTALAQDKKSVVIGSMTEKPNALLIINPPGNDQGVLFPQLTTGQRMSLKPLSPAEDGLVVFDVTAQNYYYWSAGRWENFGASKSKSSFYAIDPASFTSLAPDGYTGHYGNVLFESDHSFVTVSNRAGANQLIASADLPHNATIQEVVVHYFDNDPGNFTVQLQRKRLGGSAEDLVLWQSSGASTQVREQGLTNFNGMEVVDLENYTYRVVVRFDLDSDDDIDRLAEATLRIYGIRFKYKP